MWKRFSQQSLIFCKLNILVGGKAFMVDLNCDMGEGFGIYSFADDEEIMPFIDAANVACGFHASDPNTMSKTVELAKKFNVKVGSHPAYPDLVGFGRDL